MISSVRLCFRTYLAELMKSLTTLLIATPLLLAISFRASSSLEVNLICRLMFLSLPYSLLCASCVFILKLDYTLSLYLKTRNFDFVTTIRVFFELLSYPQQKCVLSVYIVKVHILLKKVCIKCVCMYKVCIFASANKNKEIMKVTKIGIGTYKVVDAQGTWIARGGQATVNGMWTANDCDNVDELSSENNWAVEFKTFKQLKKYSQKF